MVITLNDRTVICTASELGVRKPEQNGYELLAHSKKAFNEPQVIFIPKPKHIAQAIIFLLLVLLFGNELQDSI